MMLQIEQDKARITDIANEVTLERTVISDLATTIQQQAQAVSTDIAAIAALKEQISEEQTMTATDVS